MTTKLRVVQWATGNVGLRSLRAVIEHPTLDLAGLFVYAEAKAGVDAGTLCGIDPVGITATRDVDEIVALGADCVLYMPYFSNVDDMVRLLEAGTNIVTSRVEFQNPAFIEPTARGRLEEACLRGGTSLFCTGSSPGIGSEVVPAAVLAFQRRLDLLTVDEFADNSSRNSPEILFDAMGFGRKPTDSVTTDLEKTLRISREPSLHMLADAMGITLDGIETSIELGLATKRTEVAAGVIEAGTVAGTRLTVSGMRDGEPILRFRANWYATRDLDVDWELMHSGWRIVVDGDTPVSVLITFPVSLEDYPKVTPGLTAHPSVNAVAAVCAARPGILTALDLPHMLPTLT